ncbi:MxaK protein [Methylosinus sporium]|uniref:MxaK protein n=1 Tax=Methylosinus sporium TaxID=428 RepID=A0A549T2X6_METSR|nr:MULTISPECIES: MxaK protein [Methylosinus]MBU3889497.1 MxaK protein [Methylosinus sp. KRF6]TRL36226.1 MxaK protein [Methylosinus sporium]
MNDAARSENMRPLARLVARWRSSLLSLLLVAALAGALQGAYAAWRARADNAAISALAAGRDVETDSASAPELIAARAGFLAARAQFDKARALLEPLDSAGREELSAIAHYDLGNALLRHAFDLLERGQLEPAGPFVELARREYRRALQFRPEFWDAKYNLDVAARLVRDNPELEHSGGDELPADPKKIWTDIPGAPKGLP